MLEAIVKSNGSAWEYKILKDGLILVAGEDADKLKAESKAEALRQEIAHRYRIKGQ